MVMETVWSICPSPSTWQVDSRNSHAESLSGLFWNFSYLSHRSLLCPHSATSKSTPRNNIHSKALCAKILGKRFPFCILPLFLPRVAFERIGTTRVSFPSPTLEEQAENGQEQTPIIQLYFPSQPIDPGSKYRAPLLLPVHPAPHASA